MAFYSFDAVHKRGRCLSLSVCHDPVLCQNGLTYRRNPFTTW